MAHICSQSGVSAHCDAVQKDCFIKGLVVINERVELSAVTQSYFVMDRLSAPGPSCKSNTFRPPGRFHLFYFFFFFFNFTHVCKILGCVLGSDDVHKHRDD